MEEKGTDQRDAAAWSAAKKHRPKYAKPVAAYADTYQVTERGLKKWVEKAREDWILSGSRPGGPEFPPLDDPAKMLGWWELHMTRRPSMVLLSLAGRTEVVGALPKGPESSGVVEPSPIPQRTAIDFATLAEMDLAGAAAAQRKVVAASLQAYRAALENPNTDEATVTLMARRYDNAIERLRAVEKSLTSAEIERGERPHISEVRAELHPLLSNLALSFVDVLVDRVGLARPKARELADEWFRELAASRFGTLVASPEQQPAAA